MYNHIQTSCALESARIYEIRGTSMNIVCLDMEGVLVPEIWIAFAEASGIPQLRRTTRDEPDYDKLMRYRLEILKEHGLGLPEIQATIAKIDPLPGAKAFLDELRTLTQVIILSDTFEEFAKPLMEKLGWPTIFCNSLEVVESGEITGYRMRCEKSKLTRPAKRVSFLKAQRRSRQTIQSCQPMKSSGICWRPSGRRCNTVWLQGRNLPMMRCSK